ncbi:MAG: YifB family Mg chelatase-like AAA ATPase [Betaproteobacteria bacterium]|nr:YifB family Mg chelatase-like AAA ATPase [Betaproteobacteria bacterium]
MGLAVVHTRTLEGLQAEPVQVEVHLANGLPCITLVGLADTEVREARERVRSALGHSGWDYPVNQRITVSLAPADLPKASSRFDLPIALGILAAQGVLDKQALGSHEFAGELSLAGELRPVQGALALALGLQRSAQQTGCAPRCLVLPAANAAEAAWVPGVKVVGAQHLRDVVQHLMPGAQAVPLPQTPAPLDLASSTPTPLPAAGCLRDIRGQAQGKRALELAAAGHHSLLLVGPPGAGKSMLAQRLQGLLPLLSPEQALECAALRSLLSSTEAADRFAGPAGAVGWRRRPWRAPHHSCTMAALVGGGRPPRPGEISLAHHGILFLDELVEFPRRTLEALREPLELGHVTISRAARQARFPSQLLLVAAMNPCPCGWLGSRSPGAPACRCTPDAVQRYQARLSGPLLDRLDLQLEVPASTPAELLRPPEGPDSISVAQRVARTREHQLQRQGCCNAHLGAAALLEHAPLHEASQAFLQRAAELLGLSGRGVHRVLRVARTVADLAQAPRVEVPHLAEALQMRRGLMSRAVA